MYLDVEVCHYVGEAAVNTPNSHRIGMERFKVLDSQTEYRDGFCVVQIDSNNPVFYSWDESQPGREERALSENKKKDIKKLLGKEFREEWVELAELQCDCFGRFGVPRMGALRRSAELRRLSSALRLVQTFLVRTRYSHQLKIY
ncbi:hypothetical protein EVAR_81503_1 [Eumeta japonica]|uniref:Uncharacterized protein n=1 Tax=Eumeta variegata TaxID=151549 RepID=A0A4C1W3Q7_EUMVA|nr:hypothetical protein EVAR_81503_1 [Eumeta japonica]